MAPRSLPLCRNRLPTGHRAPGCTASSSTAPCTEPQGKDPALAELGWFRESSKEETHDVRDLSPNQWGLYDMHGNVWEWCADWYGDYNADDQVDPTGAGSGRERVSRGGSWLLQAWFCRSAYRRWRDPSDRYGFLGFRLASGQ